MIDWNACPAGEREPDHVSGAWVFRGTCEETYNGSGALIKLINKEAFDPRKTLPKTESCVVSISALSGRRGRFRRMNHPKREKALRAEGRPPWLVLARASAHRRYIVPVRGSSQREGK